MVELVLHILREKLTIQPPSSYLRIPKIPIPQKPLRSDDRLLVNRFTRIGLHLLFICLPPILNVALGVLLRHLVLPVNVSLALFVQEFIDPLPGFLGVAEGFLICEKLKFFWSRDRGFNRCIRAEWF